MMHNWNWNPQTKTIGEFTLGAPYADLKTPLEHLLRYDYEEFDTYLIEDVKHSKLFVVDGLIDSVQCACHFVVEGNDLLGKTVAEAEAIMESSFQLLQDDPRWSIYGIDENLQLMMDKEKANSPIIYIFVNRAKNHT